MTRKEKITKIKKILDDWGATSVGELELDHSPLVNSIGDEIVALAEDFDKDEVEIVVYHGEHEIDSFYMPYEDLSEDVISEIFEIMKNYDAKMEEENK